MLSPEQIAEAAMWITSGWPHQIRPIPLDRAIREAVRETPEHRAAVDAAKRAACEAVCQELGVDPSIMRFGENKRRLEELHPEYSRRVPNPDEDPSIMVWVIGKERPNDIFEWPWGGGKGYPRPASELPDGWIADGVEESYGGGGDSPTESGYGWHGEDFDLGASCVRAKILAHVHPVEIPWEEWIVLRDAAQRDYHRISSEITRTVLKIQDRVAKLVDPESVVSWTSEDEAAVLVAAEERRAEMAKAAAESAPIRKWIEEQGSTFAEQINRQIPAPLRVSIHEREQMGRSLVYVCLSIGRSAGGDIMRDSIPSEKEVLDWVRTKIKADPRVGTAVAHAQLEAALRAHGLDPRDWDSGLSPRGEPQLRRKVRGGGFVIVDL